MSVRKPKLYQFYFLAGAVIVLGSFVILQLNSLLMPPEIDYSNTAAALSPVSDRGVQRISLDSDTAFQLIQDVPVSVQTQSINAVTQKIAGNRPYYIGFVSDEEQLLLEYINQARANPQLEASRILATLDPATQRDLALYRVDRDQFTNQINALQPAPPVAWDYRLMNVAERQVLEQFTHSYQGHISPVDGTVPLVRIAQAGYPALGIGENVFVSARSVEHGHNSLYIDVGNGVGGMQLPPGHRNNVTNPLFTEVGIRILNGADSKVGPQLITQEFGYRNDSHPYILGVAYHDYNNNQAYDSGEGIDGLEVRTPQALSTGSGVFFATTTYSGGYQIPVRPGSSSVTLKLRNGTSMSIPFEVKKDNLKKDFRIPYTAPTISGQRTGTRGVSHTYTTRPISTASSYTFEIVPLDTAENSIGILGAEDGSDGVVPSLTGRYAVRTAVPGASGIYAYHLVHPTPTDQYIEIETPIILSTESNLTFISKLSRATANQIARVEVAEVGTGYTKFVHTKVGDQVIVSTTTETLWTRVWEQKGTADPAFISNSVSLAAYANKTIKIRFVYDHVGGNYYNQTAADFGFYFDEVSVSNALVYAGTPVVVSRSTPSFDFAPDTDNTYALRVRGNTTQRNLPWGPAFIVQTTHLPENI